MQGVKAKIGITGKKYSICDHANSQSKWTARRATSSVNVTRARSERFRAARSMW